MVRLQQRTKRSGREVYCHFKSSTSAPHSAIEAGSKAAYSTSQFVDEAMFELGYSNYCKPPRTVLSNSMTAVAFVRFD
jgi:hypothetical protein